MCHQLPPPRPQGPRATPAPVPPMSQTALLPLCGHWCVFTVSSERTGGPRARIASSVERKRGRASGWGWCLSGGGGWDREAWSGEREGRPPESEQAVPMGEALLPPQRVLADWSLAGCGSFKPLGQHRVWRILPPPPWPFLFLRPVLVSPSGSDATRTGALCLLATTTPGSCSPCPCPAQGAATGAGSPASHAMT